MRKNRIIEKDTHVEIVITSGKYGVHTCYVDKEDYPKVQGINWSLHKSGNNIYARGIVKGKQVQMHRYLSNCPRGKVIDHRSRNGLDNRRDNMFVVDNRTNTSNRRAGSNTGYVGVHKRKTGVYVASIKVDGVSYALGTYECPIEAARAVNKERIAHFGSQSVDRKAIIKD